MVLPDWLATLKDMLIFDELNPASIVQFETDFDNATMGKSNFTNVEHHMAQFGITFLSTGSSEPEVTTEIDDIIALHQREIDNGEGDVTNQEWDDAKAAADLAEINAKEVSKHVIESASYSCEFRDPLYIANALHSAAHSHEDPFPDDQQEAELLLAYDTIASHLITLLTAAPN